MSGGPWGRAAPLPPSPWGAPAPGAGEAPFSRSEAEVRPAEDEALGIARERQAFYAARAKHFDFRSAARANAWRTAALAILLALCAAGVGAAASLALTGGKPALGPMGIAGGTLLLLSLFCSWVSLRGADHRVLASQGGIEVTGTESGEAGRLARRLHNVTAEMALASGMPMPKVYLLPEQGLNAFAVGRTPDVAAVAATEGLVRALSRDELQAVMAHEMAHIAQRDTLVMVSAAATAGLLLVVVDLLHSVARGSDSRKLGGLFLVGFLVAWLVAAVVVPLLKMALSRQREYLADANAVRFTRNPGAMASALRAISSNPRVEAAGRDVSGMYVMNPLSGEERSSWWSTHPSVDERISRIIAEGKSLPSAGRAARGPSAP